MSLENKTLKKYLQVVLRFFYINFTILKGVQKKNYQQ